MKSDSEKYYFDILNNGITILAQDVNSDNPNNIRFLTIKNPKIINGLQTSTTIFNLYNTYPNLDTPRKEFAQCNVLVKILKQPEETIADKIIISTNTQNAIVKYHRMSISPIIIEWQRQLKVDGYEVSIKDGEKDSEFNIYKIMLYWFAMNTKPHRVKHSTEKILEDIALTISDDKKAKESFMENINGKYEDILLATQLAKEVKERKVTYYAYHMAYIVYKISIEEELDLGKTFQTYYEKIKTLLEKDDANIKNTSYWRSQASSNLCDEIFENKQYKSLN